MLLTFNTTTLKSHLRLQQQACFGINRNEYDWKNVIFQSSFYSLGAVAFGWKHNAGGLSQSHLVGSGSDGGSEGGLELPTQHRQLRLSVRGSGPREELSADTSARNDLVWVPQKSAQMSRSSPRRSLEDRTRSSSHAHTRPPRNTLRSTSRSP